MIRTRRLPPPRTHPARALTSVDRPRRSGRTRRIPRTTFRSGRRSTRCARYQHLNATYRGSLPTLGPNDVGVNPWTSAGPSKAEYPDVLTFFGADYTAAGRTTALAIRQPCSAEDCTLFLGAAGGGIWRTTNALGDPGTQNWQFISGSFGSNAIGVMSWEPDNRLYVGTGEPHASGDSEAGLGIWRSGDRGNTWTHFPSITHTNSVANGDYTGDAFAGRAISDDHHRTGQPAEHLGELDPCRSRRRFGHGQRDFHPAPAAASVPASTTRPTAARRSTSSGTATEAFAASAVSRSIRVTPTSSTQRRYSQGTWRSDNGGVTWTLIKDPLVPQSIDNAVRAEIAVTKLPNGNTRLYLAQGASGPDAGEPPAEVWRTDDAQHATTTSGWTNLTTNRTSNYCTGQCWYDNYVVTPRGHPDWVYVGGSFQYGEYGFSSNGRAVLYSTDAGQTWSDLTADNTMQPKDPANCCDPRPWAANALHPDQHSLVVNPNNPTQVFEGSDGGLMRSSGAFADQSSDCDSRPLGPISMAKCHELLSSVPTTWTSLNAGLSTLQFQSLSVNPQDSRAVMGGTQDNGTFQGVGDNVTWPQIIYGDGGQSGWNATAGKMRFNSFFGQFHDANVNSGDPTKWYIIGGPIASSPEGSNFYVPIVADPNPAAANTIYEGSQSVWRTKDWGGRPGRSSRRPAPSSSCRVQIRAAVTSSASGARAI